MRKSSTNHNPCNADISTKTSSIVLSDEQGRPILELSFDSAHVMPLVMSIEPLLAGIGYVKPHCDYIFLCTYCNRNKPVKEKLQFWIVLVELLGSRSAWKLSSGSSVGKFKDKIENCWQLAAAFVETIGRQLIKQQADKNMISIKYRGSIIVIVAFHCKRLKDTLRSLLHVKPGYQNIRNIILVCKPSVHRVSISNICPPCCKGIVVFENDNTCTCITGENEG